MVQKVRILMISPAIPNDTLSFGPEFPADLRAQIEEALVAFAETDAWAESIGSQDFYNWTGLEPATDAEYDFIRQMVAATGFSIEDIRLVPRDQLTARPRAGATRPGSALVPTDRSSEKTQLPRHAQHPKSHQRL